MYFTNALSQADEEWTQHKKIINFTAEKSLKRCIPQHFQFISVEWESRDEGGGEGGGGGGGRQGLAHIIEDERRIRSDFALDVVAGMLKKDPLRFRAKQGGGGGVSAAAAAIADGEDEKRVRDFLAKYEYDTFDWVKYI